MTNGNPRPAAGTLLEQINPEDPTPLYLKVMRAIREAIAHNRFAPNAALPPERELADRFGVSRITIRKALAGLAEQGLLSKRQGAGNFVAAEPSRIEKSLSNITSFSEDMASRSLVPSSQWVSKTRGLVTPEDALALGLSPGSAVFRFSRVRFADDTPMAFEVATIPGFCLPSAEAVGESLYDALEASGYRPIRALQRLRAINLDAEQAAYLEAEVGAAALLIERRGFHRNGLAVEVTVSCYRGDAYDFLAELVE